MSDPKTSKDPFSRYDPRRKYNQALIVVLAVLLLAILFTIATHLRTNSISEALRNDLNSLFLSGTDAASTNDLMEGTKQALSSARTQLLVLGIISVAVALLLIYRYVASGIRSVALEVWIRHLGEGNLDYHVEMKGRDEIAEAAVALEALRQRSIRALQLDLVEKLSRELQDRNEELEQVLLELRQTQEQIILRQKLAELGELTAGVAHEIRNPLNFMKNFSEASEDLLDELKEALEGQMDYVPDDQRGVIADISQQLTMNMERIRSHGDRAERIIRDMLLIGRGGGNAQAVNLNDLLRDRTNLAYYSAHAQDPDLELDIRYDLDPSVGEVLVVPEDMGRVFINLVNNSCYAIGEKRQSIDGQGEPYAPTLRLKTRRLEDTIEVRVRDNGTGISPDIMDKIFNPFFTTKPAGKGTGLGLSLSNDVVRQHGGSIEPDSELGDFTEMAVSIPIRDDVEQASD